MFTHRVRIASWTYLLWLGLGTPGYALVTDYTVDHLPIVVGDSVTRSAVDDGNGPMATDYIWEWQPTGGADWITFIGTGASACTATEAFPGTGTVRLTVKYGMPCDMHADVVVTHTFAVNAPDTETITNTLPATVTDAFNDEDFPLTFVYTYGTKQVTMDASTTMREKITNFTLFGTGSPDGDFENPDPSRFSFIGNTLTDLKRFTYNKTPANWAAKTVGDTFCEYDQQNRMLYIDVAGNSQHIDFPVQHFKYKIGASGTWTLGQ